jgi:hypothetical protein
VGPHEVIKTREDKMAADKKIDFFIIDVLKENGACTNGTPDDFQNPMQFLIKVN